MPFSLPSYFAGVGTVCVAIAVGFGGGFLLGSSGNTPDPPNRLMRVTSQSSAPVSPQQKGTAAPEASQLSAYAPDAGDAAVRKVGLRQESPAVPARSDVSPPAMSLVSAEDTAAKLSESSHEAPSNAKPRTRDTRKLVDRSERADRRNGERRRSSERKTRDAAQHPQPNTQEAIVIREGESDGEGAPRLGLFREE